VTFGIQELAQLGQEDCKDIADESHDLLDHAGNWRVLGVCLDVKNTILDALVRSLLVLSYVELGFL